MASQVTWKILKSAIIDHFPIITSINQRVDGTSQSKRSWNFRKANWEKFTSELETLCSLSSPNTLYEGLQSFSSHINAAAKRSIPRIKRIDDWITFWKDTNIEKLINERDKLSLERQKNNTETNRTRLMNLCHEVQEHWKVLQTLNNLSTHQKSNLLSNIISSSGRDAATNKETASLLAKHYENKSKLTFIANDRKLLRTYRKTIQDSKRYNYKNIFTIPFSMEELEAVIAKMNPGKAPGKLPKIWKLSIVIPILKPNKNASECKHYRPIALSSFLCTLMERHIEQIANKALGKLNILQKLCGTSWGSRPQTLKITFCTVIRTVLEYATPIWTPTSISVKRKLDSVQHRAAKIIIGAVSSTNNEKAEQECGLPPLESRRKLATIMFTNKLLWFGYGLDHISRRDFDKWKNSTRLKKSSTLQLDSEIRKELNLEHSSLEFLQDPLIPNKPTKEHIFRIGIVAAKF
ncbi:reverse transcriptase domain-containing protein [Trichonephila clavipes]|nr:reverse transcriptase domain-containing protein [Trichonephila clavipes]